MRFCSRSSLALGPLISAFLGAALVLTASRAASAAPCADLPAPVIYGLGGSATKPLLSKIAGGLTAAGTLSVVYQAPGACLGINGLGSSWYQNPALALRVDGRELAEGTTIDAIAGQAFALTASWPACESPAPCEGAERYVAFDPATRALVDRREAMRVTWLSTAGTLADDRTGRDEGDLVLRTTTTFTAPREAGTTTVIVVLRDTRGGVAWRTFRVTTT